MSRLIAAARAYIKDLEDHEGAEGFSDSTAKLRKEWEEALAQHRENQKRIAARKKEMS